MEQFKQYRISVDENLSVVYCDSEFLTYLGREKVTTLDQVIPPQDAIQLRNAIFALQSGAPGLSCFRILTSSGRLNWIAANIERSDNAGKTIRMELSDIQTLKADEALAQFDEMTGLMNKLAITEYAKMMTRQYPRKFFYFVLMDIDHFKTVNDTFGHMCGDEVIISVAHTIRECVGELGVVGRIGGDEFMIVLEEVDNKPQARKVLANIRETVEDRFKNYKGAMNITVSIGAAFYPDYAADYDELFKLTDKMLYRAKTRGRNRYIIYTPEVHGDLRELNKTGDVVRQAPKEDDKIGLMLNFMENFLRKPEIPIQTAIEQVLSAYNLDEVHVVYDDLEVSRYGVSRSEMAKGSFRIEDRNVAFPILNSEEIKEALNQNNLAVLAVFDLNKDTQKEILAFMDKKYRLMVVYRMDQSKRGGYIVYLTEWDSSCRLSEADISDLIYFGRMVELTTQDR